MRTPLVVCGLAAEAKTLRALTGCSFAIGGGDQARLARELAASTAPGFISIGIAGALAPGLRPGDLRVASAVISPSGDRFRPDVGWTNALVGRLETTTAVFAGADAPVATSAAKTAMHAGLGADLVDMESHVTAAAAAAKGVPFAAVRIVSDGAGRDLPEAASLGMRPDGGIDLPAILGSLLRHPGQLPDLLRTGTDARKAFAELFRCGQLLGPSLAILDLGETLLHVP